MHSTLRVLQGLTGLRELARGGVMSIGNFDGVHLGHLRIIERARALRANAASNGNGGTSGGGTSGGGGSSGGGDLSDERGAMRIAVVTFEPHPLTVLRPQAVPARLTPPAMKRALLAAAGVDDLVELPPTSEVLDLSAEAFWAILRDDVRPAHLIEGDSFNFGRGRGGTIGRLREWCAETNGATTLNVIDPVRVALCDMLAVDVNSSLIRWLIANGRARDAAICLGRPYTIEGTVVKGFERGRSIGVPTANLAVIDQQIPADGVYAARCVVDQTTYPVALSVGVAPTFVDGSPRRQVEAHLIGFSGDLYGRSLSIDVADWIRDQQKFASVDALKAQLSRDITCAQLKSTADLTRSFAVST